MEHENLSITFNPIGLIHSPFTNLADMPIQPSSDFSAAGSVDIFPEYAAGLLDIEGFSHIILIYHLHKSNKSSLLVTPFLDTKPHGVFSTRAPNRPNPIGLSVVKLKGVKGSILYVENLDILNGTPLLDIKPYVPEFDSTAAFRLGWLETAASKVRTKRSDERFT